MTILVFYDFSQRLKSSPISNDSLDITRSYSAVFVIKERLGIYGAARNCTTYTFETDCSYFEQLR